MRVYDIYGGGKNRYNTHQCQRVRHGQEGGGESEDDTSEGCDALEQPEHSEAPQ